MAIKITETTAKIRKNRYHLSVVYSLTIYQYYFPNKQSEQQFHSINLIRYLTICVHCLSEGNLWRCTRRFQLSSLWPLKWKLLVHSFGAVHFDLCTSALFVQGVVGEYYSGVSVELMFGFCILNVCFQENTMKEANFTRSVLIHSSLWQHFSICKKPHNWNQQSALANNVQL